MNLKTYTTKPVQVFAVQVTPSNIGLLAKIASISWDDENDVSQLHIHTSGDIQRAGYGDWLVLGPGDRWYSETDSVFRANYDEVELEITDVEAAR